MSETQSSPVLEVRRVGKKFPSVKALDDVSLELQAGEVLAVIGENGAGKSTLMKILAGVESPTSGELYVEGQPRSFSSVEQALQAGISLIHQELNLSTNLEVGANIFLGREPTRFGLIDGRKVEREAMKFLKMVGLDVSPRTLVGKLSIGKQQLVEIAKALSTRARVLIMDEPTSSLSQHETETLFGVVTALRDRGVSVIYISHRLGEIEELADRVVVLRDGRYVGQLSRDELNHDAMVSMMVGRDVSKFYHRAAHETGAEVLTVDQLRTPANPRLPLSFSIRAGEIVGIAGLVGAGRSELLTTLFGVTPAVAGSMRLGRLSHPPRTTVEAIEAGIVLAPEDRRLTGLILSMSVKRNLSLATLRRDATLGFLNRSSENRVSHDMSKLLQIKSSGDDQVVQYLSGGNQQKVVLGKWLATKPRLLMLDEPTRGIDVGAKEEIYKLMHELAGQGVAILFVSSEMEEIFGLSDRTLVMHEGRITGELAQEQLSEAAVMNLATGGNPSTSSRTSA
ncbi:MAG: sugar ABC transporter ATP-binding protein [Planctomycetales bacterium]|nr:sugar ABC transporter ATP-binding protein [Planctomycetales bacterium]